MKKVNRRELENQTDLSMLALMYAIAGDEGRSEYVRALARAKSELSNQLESKEMVVA